MTLSIKLCAPGTRSGNKFYYAKIRADRDYEISTRTTDLEEAQRRAELFLRKVMVSLQPTTPLGAIRDLIGSALLTLDGIRLLPREADCSFAVYFLLRDGALQYIGQTSRLSRRLRDHFAANQFAFNETRVLACQPDELDLLEAAYIWFFRPPHNRGLRGRDK